MNTSTSDQDLIDIEQGLMKHVAHLIGTQGHSALAVAAVLCKLSLQIYRTVMTQQEYHDIVDAVSGMRDRIRPLLGLQNSPDEPLH